MDRFQKLAMSGLTTDTEIIFLGTGTSIGVPVIGCHCDVCTSSDPKNNRLRSSILVRSPEGTLVVDTGPDFRQQCLREKIDHLDAAIFTHAHTDHIMGFDDLRRFTVGNESTIDIYANRCCLDRLERCFDYVFSGKNIYHGYLKPVPHQIVGPFSVCGWEITPLPVSHGKVDTIGFHFLSRTGIRFAYIPDAKTLSAAALHQIQEIPLLIVDGLQMSGHSTHLSIPESIEIARQVKARQVWLTHLSCRVNYQLIEPDLPPHIRIAWDGLAIDL
jgi:phosphoribosyl 1,2-cyclic phosphate phosphodiesterase